MSEIIVAVLICAAVSSLIALGVKLERGRAALDVAKKAHDILESRDSIEKKLNETKNQIASGNLDNRDISELLSSYQKD